MRHIFTLTAIALLVFTLSCAKATKSNFQKVANDMSYAQVEKILGEPDTFETAGVGPLSASTASWKSDEGTISIQFVNDKVKVLRFHDAETGDAQD